MEYDYIIVQSVLIKEKGKYASVHIRPLPDQDPYVETMFVQCSKVLTTNFPVGTKFRIKVKIITPRNGNPYASSHYTWPFEIIKD
ncbi:hypothetical protein [Chryseobacterium luteum]|uniref:Uncharacterized protein n=1 Tax=Chryseobacterium luteum TaxID=421531 RepID=A0A085Z0C1_9FLAO|nr:hypothetical protein [Chryseobacterium luteum]KFE97884.1 hypothetical protein IX38_19665 [Chryseobacterium luteum]